MITLEMPRLSEAGSGIYFLDPLANGEGPSSLQVGEKRLERFMDYIYLPVPTEELNRQQIQIVNRLRRPLIGQKRKHAVSQMVKHSLAGLISAVRPEQVLEWGCGYESLQQLLGDIAYVATDIDPDIRDFQTLRGVGCYLPDEVPSLVPRATVDVIVAAFVFHFRISDQDIEAMYRSLRPEGFVLANVYRRSDASRDALQRAFSIQGFRVYRRIDSKKLCSEHEYWLAARDMSEASANLVLDRLCGESSAESLTKVISQALLTRAPTVRFTSNERIADRGDRAE